MIGKSRIGLTGLKIWETNWPTPNLFVLGFIGVWIDTHVIYERVLGKKDLNR